VNGQEYEREADLEGRTEPRVEHEHRRHRQRQRIEDGPARPGFTAGPTSRRGTSSTAISTTVVISKPM
jgi:hypothetical protein